MTSPPRFKEALEVFVRHDVELIVVGGVAVRVLGLAALIRSREQAGRDKDRAVMDLLREALRASLSKDQP